MKKPYPKNRKGIAGRPFPRATGNKLTCVYCSGEQCLSLIDHLYNKYKKDFSLKRISYACDHCTRSLTIYRSVDGFYRVQNNIDKRKKWAKQFIESK